MKKLLIATLIAGSLMLTACDDKEKTALTEQAQKQAVVIDQLNEQVDALQKQVVDLAQNQSVHAEPEVLFQKSETIAVDKKAQEESGREKTTVIFDISTLKTNMAWLNELLLNQLFSQYSVEGQPKIESKEQLVELLQKLYDETLKEAKEDAPIGMESRSYMKYVGQRENLADFTLNGYTYSGGAHGLYGTQYLHVDLAKKAVFGLDDVIDKPQREKLKALLWETYSHGDQAETFTPKAEFYVTDNFYFSPNGMTFVYPLYTLGSFAEGEKELTLYWWQIKDLLTPPFKFLANDITE